MEEEEDETKFQFQQVLPDKNPSKVCQISFIRTFTQF